MSSRRKRFLIARPDGSYSKDDACKIGPLSTRLTAKATQRPFAGWRFGTKMKEQGSAEIVWSDTEMSRGGAVASVLREAARRDNLGDLYVIEHVATESQFRVRVAEVTVKLSVVSGANKHCAKGHRAVSRKFKDAIVSWGRYACRSIAGTSTPSQHSAVDAKGNPSANAEDFHGSARDMKKLVKFLIDNDHLNVRNVIFDGKIYSLGNGFNPDNYTGSCPHKQHVHVDYDPPAKHYCSDN